MNYQKYFFFVLAYTIFFSVELFPQDINVLILLPNKHCETYYYNRDNFESYGWKVTVAGVTQNINPDPAYAGLLGCPVVVADTLVSEITDVSNFDCVVIMPGAPWSGNPNADQINSTETISLLQAADSIGILIAGFATGVRVMAAADIIQGHNVTGWIEYENEFTAAGANYLGGDILPVIDGNIVTACDIGDFYHYENCEAVATGLERLRARVNKKRLFENKSSIKSKSILENTIWSRTIGGSNADGGSWIERTEDNGFIITGYTYSSGNGNSDVLLLKTNSEGVVEWTESFGGEGKDVGNCVRVSNDGYLVLGFTYSFGSGDADAYLIKTDFHGNEIWSKTYGGENLDIGKSLIITRDNQYVFCGYTQSYNAIRDDVYLVKTDTSGNLIWSKTYTYDISNPQSDMAYDLIEAADGSYVISAVTGFYQAIGLGVGNRDIWIIKTDSSGVIYSSEIYDYINSGHSNQQFPQSIVENEEGNLLIAAQTDVFYTDFLDYYLVNINESGGQVWGKFFGNRPNYDYPKDMIITNDKSVAICGTENSFNDPYNDIYIVKTDSNGTQNWNQRFGGNGYEWGTSICEADDGNYVVLGQTNSFGNGSFDIYLIKIDNQLVNVIDENIPNTYGLSQNFPNPFNPSTTIKFRTNKREFVSLKVYDLLGNEIATLVNEEKPAGTYTLNFDSKGLSSGIYFYCIQTDSFIETRKMVFVK